MFGQMDEPPGVRLRWRFLRSPMAEYFRDVQRQDVLLFIDNIFPPHQAAPSSSTLLGRMPSAVGYQVPTLAGEMGMLHVRITSLKGHRSLRSKRSTSRPMTSPTLRLTRPSAHLDATTVLSRPLTAIGIWHPGADPLDSTEPCARSQIVGAERYGDGR